MIRMLFVCHGNICRSPMAEFLMRDLVKQRGLSERVWIRSAATSTEEICGGIGNPVYPPAKAELAKHGISCDEKRAVLLRRSDYERYDLLIGMDRYNLQSMQRLFRGDPAHKLHLLMDFTEQSREVADPWYSGRFDVAYRDIEEGCTALLDSLLKHI